MINLKTECKAVGITVADLSELLEVPYNTLNKWTKSRPQLLHVIFEGLQSEKRIKILGDIWLEETKPTAGDSGA